MKKLVCLVLALLLVLPTGALAFRDRVIVRKADKARDITSKYDVFCMDYSMMLPGSDTGFAAKSTAKVTTTTGVNGKEQGAFCIEDTVAGTSYSGVNTQKYFTPVKEGVVAMEVMFKVEKRTDEFLALAMCLRSGSSQACRFMVRGAGDGYLLFTDEAGTQYQYNKTEKIVVGAWHKLRVELDLDNLVAQTEMTMYHPDGEKYVCKEALKLHNTWKQGLAVDNFHIETRQYDGFLYFDYIKVEKGCPWTDYADKKPRPTPIPLPLVPTPTQNPIKGITNVTYNGEYMYFTQAPVLEGDDLMVTVRNAIRALGFDESYADGKYIGTKGDNTIEITPGSATVKYNGKSATLGKAATNDRIPVVSLTDLAEVTGASCTYDSVNNVYVITDMEVAQ